MNDYSKIFEFNFLNKNDFINLYKEKKKQESEYLINELKYQGKNLALGTQKQGKCKSLSGFPQCREQK